MTPRRVLTTLVVANLIIIVFAIILGLSTAGKPSRYFGEGRFTTGFSCAQLLATAFLSSRIFLARQPLASNVGPLSAAWVWAFIAAGFVYLAGDDAFQIHEQLDATLHATLHIQETEFTDRLDDAIIAIYGFIGLAVLWLFRKEIFFSHQIRKPLRGGFLCLFASVACDAISNGDQFLAWLSSNVATEKRLNSWFGVGDGAFTLLAEGFFLAAFYLVNRATIASPRPAMQSTVSVPQSPYDGSGSLY